jgi:hypothetical protein
MQLVLRKVSHLQASIFEKSHLLSPCQSQMRGLFHQLEGSIVMAPTSTPRPSEDAVLLHVLTHLRRIRFLEQTVLSVLAD